MRGKEGALSAEEEEGEGGMVGEGEEVRGGAGVGWKNLRRVSSGEARRVGVEAPYHPARGEGSGGNEALSRKEPLVEDRAPSSRGDMRTTNGPTGGECW